MIPVTGIGSLPHDNPAEAVAFVRRWCPTLPHWPQLPALGCVELMLPQFAAGALGWSADATGGLIPGDAEALDAAPDFHVGFAGLAGLAAESPLTAKGQVVGPATVSVLLGGKVPMTTLVRRAMAHLDAQATTLGVAAEAFLGQLDEPLLPFASDEERDGLAAMVALRRAAGQRTMVHCCGAVPWALLLATGADVLSFDMALVPPPAGQTCDGVERWLRGGGRLALGAVPTTGDSDREECLRMTVSWLQSARLYAPWMHDRLMITPACGLGLRSIEVATRVMGVCSAVAAALEAGLGE